MDRGFQNAGASSNPLLQALVRISEKPESSELTAEDKKVLMHLGAGVVVRWNNLPQDIQRELFDAAAAMDETPHHLADVRNHLAVFLHHHKGRPLSS